jgi:hypothetical protein
LEAEVEEEEEVTAMAAGCEIRAYMLKSVTRGRKSHRDLTDDRATHLGGGGDGGMGGGGAGLRSDKRVCVR